MNADDQRIRELAYEIWQSEGCPVGEEARHWEMARKLAEAENSSPAAKPARARKTATKPTDATPAAVAKPATTKNGSRTAKATPKATDAAAGTPEVMKKTRAPRKPKET
ncbi:hypothetical protein DN824_18030 [Stutzerimonas nosocomialis]|uniref:DUF2934 domain-containing protein n=1 Tax=Stutzerimonas nosocomialis TaxID=1056496 RepID=A0A5R9Q9G2_9GAMM|nr:DUF2934 domain-containing protein [Stutzerimonas nosocomialis]TLX55755.1 hypothetical protein DN824_18030 [Stutzerimonas nosocomialis]TLX56047.1 hypothetical protein DN826_09090 [Stutzerimonas nosocomialis]TLX61640.1 hypothetical protein DN820_20345 [Stutzerimonas nosocomialis]